MRKKPKPIRVSITQVVSASFCEKKAVLDHVYGKRTTPENRLKAARGVQEHLLFEHEGKMLVKRNGGRVPGGRRDNRCFIATCVYGADAPQTNVLRNWRDCVLAQSVVGRWFIGAYYRLSPCVVAVIQNRARLRQCVRKVLDVIVSGVEKR